MLYLYAWTKAIFLARIDNLVAGALWGVVCAVALFALLLPASSERPDPLRDVHWELRRGTEPEDPIPKIVGCFNPAQSYPTDRLVLTYPVPCSVKDGQRQAPGQRAR